MMGHTNQTVHRGWTSHQNKLFETALVMFPTEDPDRWQKIAGHVPGKTPPEIWEHYEALLHDVSAIDSGRVELPNYADDLFEPDWESEKPPSQISFARSKSGEAERKKGIPWTEEEHRLFLVGLQKYGRGDWRSISRNAVVSRTPTQVASHAQKYFLRLNSEKKEKKRSSIHDITTVNGETGGGGPGWVESPGMVGQTQLQQGSSRAFADQFPVPGSSGFGQFRYPM